MRTTFFFIIFVIYSASQLFGQLPDESLKEMVLEHNIKSLTQFNHKYEDGEPKEEGYKNIHKEFNKHGNLIKELHYRNGDVSQRLSYKYNDNQQKIEFKNYSVRNEELSYRQNIEYNDKGQKALEHRYNGSEYLKLIYEYDEDGKKEKILKKKRIGGNKYELKEKRLFDHKGNTTTVRVVDSGGELVKKFINKYDDAGHLIELSEFSPNGEKIKTITTKYNEDGKKTGEEKYQKGNFIYKKDFRYDKDGNLVEVQKEQPEEEFVISKVYEYQKENLSKEMWLEDMADKYSQKKFIFDDDGILRKVEVFYALYQYRILYTFEYEFY
jgi:hypothetical protein